MDKQIVALVGPGGKYVRIDPKARSVVHIDATSVGGHERFEAEQLADGRYTLRAVDADVILSADATKYGTDICKQFSTRARATDGNFAIGNYESWTIKREPDSKLVLAFVRYTDQGAEAERKFAGGLLSVIAQ